MMKNFMQMLTLCCLMLGAGSTGAKAQPPQLLSDSYIHDFAKVISADSKSQLQEKAKRLKEELNTEIAVVTVESLNGEEPFDYSMKMARQWNIGSPDSPLRGLLILVAVNERKTSFRTSRHLEGELPDGITGEISREMNLFFKQGDFGGGFSRGLDLISNRLKQTSDPQSLLVSSSAKSFFWLYFGLAALAAGSIGFIAYFLRKRKQETREQQRMEVAKKAREECFEQNKAGYKRTTGGKKIPRDRAAQRKAKKLSQQRYTHSPYPPASSGFDNSSSSYDNSSSNSGYEHSSSSYDDSSSSSSSSDWGSSGSDSGSSGGSDFGGGGSDSSW